MKEDKVMKNEILEFPQIITQEKHQSSYKAPYLLALAGIGGGIIAIFIGFIFIIIHALLKGDTIFNEIGTVLMIAAIPMMFLGGHFLDKAQKKPRKWNYQVIFGQ